jgi:glycosyltransferase involved in cell wall biosynthesis
VSSPPSTSARAAGASDPLVTVIVPIRNEERDIERALRSVLAQEVAPEQLEIVVVDGMSSDGTREIVGRLAREDGRIRLVDNPGRRVPPALNRGLGEAKGRYLVRVDGHAWIPPDYVSRMLDHLEAGACEAVGGKLVCHADTGFGRAVATAMSSRLGVGGSRHHYLDRRELVDHVAFPGYPVEVLHRLGGWVESLSSNQDFELDWRLGDAGGRILYDPEIVGHYRCSETPRALARQYWRYGFWKVHVLRLHPRSLRARNLVPTTFVAVLATALAVLPARRGRALLGLVLGPYLLLVGLGAARLGGRCPWSAARIAAALAIMHLSWGAGFWAGVASRIPTLRRLSHSPCVHSRGADSG